MFLGCLLLAFFGMTRVVFAIVDGRPRAAARKTSGKRFVETAGVIVPPLLLLGLSLWLGLFTPPMLRDAWSAAVAQLFPDTMSASTPFAPVEPTPPACRGRKCPNGRRRNSSRATAAELDRGARLCAWFGVPENSGDAPRRRAGV